jgi:hypothetical protein
MGGVDHDLAEPHGMLALVFERRFSNGDQPLAVANDTKVPPIVVLRQSHKAPPDLLGHGANPWFDRRGAIVDGDDGIGVLVSKGSDGDIRERPHPLSSILGGNWLRY